MNFGNILNEIAQADPEVFERTSERRDVLKNFGRGVALTALPFALGSLFNKAYGKANSTIADILNFALKLEYMEMNFYMQANQVAATLMPSQLDRDAFQTIGGHEIVHVNFLKKTIVAMGITPAIPAIAYDFTARGTFAHVFDDYEVFLAVAQTFEDTGVRAYKGSAAGLMSDNGVLKAALQIHSVEARHAAHIRQIRSRSTFGVKPWITGHQSEIANIAVQPSYDGEDNTNQAGFEITNINGKSISANAASEAFDEPLSMAAVLAIVEPFGVS